ncbi:MAG: thioredoxin-disulfide reductase [Ruminococcaceae bacterium]|nr:thioredoxin-disulfide reductase [Oscillospiraceae bacterium]
MSDKIYDVAVVGGGPAGYTAALYATRAGLDTVLIEKLSPGGQMTETAQIDNYPGFPEGVDGFTLGANMQQGAVRFGAETLNAEVLSLNLTASPKQIKTDTADIHAKTVILATGATHRHLGVENEQALVGRGLGYCAACDGMFFRGKTVAVVGGGNSAAADALYLSRICKKVYVIHRRDTLRATKIYHEPLMQAQNVAFKWNSRVVELLAEGKLTGAVIESVGDGARETLALDGLFISIGRTPATDLVKGQVALDEAGYVVADETTRTSLGGVFAVGDVRTKALRQIVTATADGAVAAHFAEEYLTQACK